MWSLFVSILVLLFGMAAGLTKEYISVTKNTSWDDAQNYCKRNYKDLATVTTAEENQRLYALMGKFVSAWIGLHRVNENQNIWKWSDGTPSSFFPWNTSQPNNYTGNQNCVEMLTDGWNNEVCNKTNIFVCYQLVSDLVLVNEKKTWEEALQYCRISYTGLASLSSEKELQLAEMERNQSQTDSVWTGLRFLNGNWLWVNKDPLGDLVSLPSCPAPPYRCGARNTKTHVWENRDCNEKLNFLCDS